MPFNVEHDGKTIKVWSEEEVEDHVKGLKVTNENLKAEKQEAIDKLKASKDEFRTLEEAKAKSDGDNDTLRRIAEEREAEKRQAVEDERKRYSDLVNITKKEKIDNFINDIVAELKPADSVKAKHLKTLLKSSYEFDVDIEQGAFKVTGDSVTNADDLKRFVSESPDYSYLLSGSGASGGGAAGSKGTGVPVKKFNEYSGAELVALKRDDPDLYNRLRDERNA